MKGILVLLALALVASTTQETNEKVLLTVGSEKVTVSEFETVFQKNNRIEEVSKEELDEYIDLFVKFKMKVLDAEAMQLDTLPSFKQELAGYRKQLARPYLTDKQEESRLIHEAYERMTEEVKASHILVLLDEDALPKDTLQAFQKISSIRNKVKNGASFDAIAKQFSEDPSAKSNGGDLGYFSAFRMVYPFETAAFSTQVGDISKPFRTRFGYHILKVVDRRPSRGEIKVAHIMVEEGEKATDLDKKVAADRLSQLQGFFNEGKTFDELVRYSDDVGSAKNEGLLPWFGTGKMVPEFEDAAFALQNIGDVSEPIKTMYGWHIIKLIEKRNVPTFEESKDDLERKIKRDSRNSQGIKKLINRIKKVHKFREFTSSIEPFYNIDLQGEWDTDVISLNKPMFYLNGKPYTQKNFAAFIETNKTPTAKDKIAQAVHSMYNDWVEKTCIDLEDSLLEEKYPEFKALMKEYRDGILLFDLMDKKVWGKAVLDTLGLQQYYNLTKDKYKWGERLEASVYTCLNQEVADRVLLLMKNRTKSSGLSSEEIALVTSGKGELFLTDEDIVSVVNLDNPLNVQLDKGSFSKGDNLFLDQAERKKGLTDLQKDDGVVIFAEIKELLPAELKTLKEAKGEVTSNYQDYLEGLWIKELQEKYPVNINQKVLDSLIE